MYGKAREKGLAIMGFSEHSPRPAGYDYTHEYREKLVRHFPDYINEVQDLADLPGGPVVLLGLEMDWLPAEQPFIEDVIRSAPYDYVLGSVHFLDHWGFDDSPEPWLAASQEECETCYQRYFMAWESMLASGLFRIAAHPDLIKIFSAAQFQAWLNKEESQAMVRRCLLTLRNSGMAMEISSAGLRKPCAEIYPGPRIMEMAASLGLQISFASDAHNPDDIAKNFDQLAEYAKSFGFSRHTVFYRGSSSQLEF